VLAYALAQGSPQTTYVLIHVVETASANYSGASSDDAETRGDEQRLELYAAQLKQRGCIVETQLGYRDRISEIVRIVKQSNADLLVMGAHKHSGLKDILYGETVDHVRHKISIPVLVVN